ncbi:hypothetical protein [Burkholderia pseudomallei]|uniref:hypothetical protein n=1 Tax=Burkholderia pseudomallei TaxID=28450 RepID=UPI0021F77B69|nr:hypothetical protein [Burkholderia pseudomallei]MCW0101055.1 hypothetical protein [Burkholderia pseudomallei]
MLIYDLRVLIFFGSFHGGCRQRQCISAPSRSIRFGNDGTQNAIHQGGPVRPILVAAEN